MRLLLALAVLVTLACQKDEDVKRPPPSLPPPPPLEVEILADEQACQRSADCTLITEDCCGCTSFGSQAGIRKDKVAAISARREPICRTLQCPMGMSDHPSCAARIAVCQDGECVPETADAATARMKPTEIAPIGDEDAGPRQPLPPFELRGKR